MARAMGFRGRACIGPGWRKVSEPKDGGGLGPDFARLLNLQFPPRHRRPRPPDEGHRPRRSAARQVQKLYQ